ncbi:MAG: NYN domain-containing protein [Dehalococcoidia bacterium]
MAVFIDGSNLYHALEQSCGRSDLNFASFITWLTKDRSLYRTYYYNIIQEEKRRPADHQQQQKFLEALSQVPYLETRFGKVAYREGQMIEKGVDIMLATDMLHYAWLDYYDMAVLVSGDGDFAYALQTVKNIGKFVQVVAFESNQSQELWKIGDTTTLLTSELLSKENLWLRSDDNKPKRKRRSTSAKPRSSTKTKKEVNKKPQK